MKLDELNEMDCDAFVAAVGWVFEHSPWVAERAWKSRPFPTLDSLHQSMVDEVKAAAPEEQLALLRAHPDLGTRITISEASTAEQFGAGLDSLTPVEFSRLKRLNREYRAKFGFPFLLAVKGTTKHDIEHALGERLKSNFETEYREALRQVYRIARFRLDDCVTRVGHQAD